MNKTADFLLYESLERELKRKRENFAVDYKLSTRPALIWQCMPADALEVDVVQEPLREALREGASSMPNDGWWYGFKSGRRPTLVFEGLASSADAGGTGWVTEIHSDGHFLAGVWNFPELPAHNQMASPAVADFYVDAFRDFGVVTSKVYKAAAYAGRAFVTCTMLQSNLLPLAGSGGRVLAPAVNRSELRWPLLTVQELDHLSSACDAMSVQFMRAYGRGDLRR